MNILKIILFVIVGLVATFFIVALFVKKEFDIEREIVINKPKQEVFDYMKFLKNQDNYSVWVMQDPNMKKSFTGTDGTVGFIYAWEGNDQAGKGEQKIKSMVEGERVDVEVRFEKPFKGISQAPMIFEAISPTQTKVRWGLKGKSSYPMNIMNLFTAGMLNSSVDKSLLTLKGILEK